jgi:hypothetical protein
VQLEVRSLLAGLQTLHIFWHGNTLGSEAL